MYYCYDCKRELELGDVATLNIRDPYATRDSPDEVIECCGYCYSENIEELHLTDDGEYYD